MAKRKTKGDDFIAGMHVHTEENADLVESLLVNNSLTGPTRSEPLRHRMHV